MVSLGRPRDLTSITHSVIFKKQGGDLTGLAAILGWFKDKEKQVDYIEHRFHFGYKDPNNDLTQASLGHGLKHATNEEGWPITWERLATSPKEGAALHGQASALRMRDTGAERTRPYMWVKRRYVLEHLGDVENVDAPACEAAI